jgi:hypothetical protein
MGQVAGAALLPPHIPRGKLHPLTVTPPFRKRSGSKERELKRLRQAHDLKLRGGRKRLSDVVAVEGPAEAYSRPSLEPSRTHVRTQEAAKPQDCSVPRRRSPTRSR